MDGLSGFREAIAAAYPMAGIQRCIIHQIRSSTRYVAWKDIKALMADLNPVYQAVTEEEAFEWLAAFKETWGKQKPGGQLGYPVHFLRISARNMANHIYH